MMAEGTHGGFTPIKVKFETVNSVRSVHTIFCKVHVIRQEHSKVPNHRTLFTLGWPAYCDSDCIKNLFSRAGEVEFVQLQNKVGFDEDAEVPATGFKVAYVVFDSTESASEALQLGGRKKSVLCKVGHTGLAKWCSNYAENRKAVKLIESTAADFMADYDTRKLEDEQMKKELQEPDDDGWITVTKKNPKLATQGKRYRQKRKKKELLNFYQFQLRETKRQQIAELRRKFEEDKQKVAEMKSKRKFKPY
ncbi:ribosomal RNA-processing protein 7 homolog A-like [Dysidea avara]|uniref:ribosomal RNA-processing protein 7 homolog A-like n=1 Tax=Dysidea avara TaxID=196820 RepID=UPI003320B017